MRPVLLEMTGFASFREQSQVNFDDVDYFALVGPTGAGKSTVIDAIGFALYGSVARWGREGMVSPALSPTANRGVVRLVFDVSGARYSVVRELRRIGGKNPQVVVRSVRLERFHEPTATGMPGDTTEVIASDSQVTPAVVGMLGLDFRQFCVCVALPQGEFAEFLHAKASSRQQILIKLLGLEIYDQIAGRAGELARDHAAREQLLGEQVEQYADATEQKVAESAARVSELIGLRERVEVAVPKLRDTMRLAEDARTKAATLGDERTLFVGVRVPDDVAVLDQRRRTAVAAGERAAAAVEVAEQTDREARAAVRAVPARAELEQVGARWRELAEVTAELPGLAERVQAAILTESETETAESLAKTAAEQARDRHDTLVQAADDLAATADRLRDDREQLATLRQPPGLTGTAAAIATAESALSDATTRLEQAEDADNSARREQADEPDHGTLSAAVTTARELQELTTQATTTAAELGRHEARLERARAGLAAALTDRDEAKQAVEQADRADRAATLRIGLKIGTACPVCDETVHKLPDQAAPADITAARDGLRLAELAHDKAEKAVRAAERARDRVLDKQSTIADRTEVCRQILSAAPLGDTLVAALAATNTESLAAAAVQAAKWLTEAIRRRTDLDARATAATADVVKARRVVAEAGRALNEAQQTIESARAGLREARDRLAGLGAPVVDDTDLRSGWRSLLEWTRNRDTELATELSTVANDATRVADEIRHATQARNDAEEKERAARTASRKAVAGLEAKRTRLDERRSRHDDLVATLTDAPTADSIEQSLGRLTQLEQLAAVADSALGTARQRAAAAVKCGQDVERLVAESRRALDRAREPLVHLGAPVLAGDELSADWSMLVEWVTAESARRQADLVTATGDVRNLMAQAQAAEQRLLADLTANRVAVKPDAEQGAATATLISVAAALAAAEVEHDTLDRRHRIALTMVADIDTERTSARVAKKVADLLRSNNFPRWLVASALDTLISAASASLMDLSAGQFELTHANGEFLIVDHNQADTTRSVKTLSGGETFQASLALALALSTHVGGLAEAGAARLDAILLDEGFGTLDESTLDMVAATLDNIAASGSRMVGIITHVSALADRIPVRYQVSRDSTGSHVVREGV